MCRCAPPLGKRDCHVDCHVYCHVIVMYLSCNCHVIVRCPPPLTLLSPPWAPGLNRKGICLDCVWEGPGRNTLGHLRWPLSAKQRRRTIVAIGPQGSRQVAINLVVASDAEVPVSLPLRMPGPADTFK